MKFSVFGLTSLASCLLALLTSAVFVRWVLPTRYRSELGNKNRYIAIDGVRGYLAFSVYLHHCLITVVYMQRGLWLRPPHNLENQLGETSVAIFFMITAFLFGGRVWKKRDLDIRQFFFSRIFRIYPLYIFLTLMTCIAVGYKSHWIEIDSTATNAKNILRWLMFQSPNINRYPYTKLIVAGVTWTLLYEAAFYISLPLFVWAFLKGGRPWRYVLSLAMIAAVCRYNHLSAWIAATFLGGGAAIWWRLDVRRVQWAQSKLAATIALGSILAVLFFLYLPFNLPGIILLSVFFVAIASDNTLFGILRFPAALWLGEISYSIYLCHGIVLWVIVQNLLPKLSFFHATSRWLPLISVGITPILFLFCSTTYLLIERPFIDLGHAISKLKKTRMSMQVCAPQQENVS